jgi:hypothetical protein
LASLGQRLRGHLAEDEQDHGDDERGQMPPRGFDTFMSSMRLVSMTAKG